MGVVWTIPALADLDQIQDFIAQDSPAVAFRFASDLMCRADAVLGPNPFGGRRGRVAGTREWVMPGTTYVVVYRVKARVEVLAVVHAAREWPEAF